MDLAARPSSLPVDPGGRLGALDGLRGVSALAVVSAHVTCYLGLLPWNTLGGMGVLMFFVLSGYLIAEVCWRAPATTAAYRRFLRRRVRRLLPVAAALALVGAPVLVLAGGLPTSLVARDAVLALTQTTGFAMAAGQETLAPFQPTWSLTVEWCFYLTFPLVLAGLRRRGTGVAAAARVMAGTAAGLYLVGLALSDLVFYTAPVATLGALYAGAALATWHRSLGEVDRVVDPARTAMWLAIPAVFVLLPGSPLGWAWKVAVFPATVAATLVVLQGCRYGNAVSRLLESSPLRAVGRSSYSLYVWHVPVLWVVWVRTPDLAPWGQAALAVLAVAVVTAVSHRFVERPFLPGRDRVAGAVASRPVGAADVLPTPAAKDALPGPILTG